MADISNAPNFSVPVGDGGSPKSIYSFFLFQQAAKHQWVMSNKDDNFYNIERSCLSLLSFCTPMGKREELFAKYYAEKERLKKDEGMLEEAAIVSASVLVVGKLMDHLNAVLELSEESNGGFV